MIFCKKCIKCPVRMFIEEFCYNRYKDYKKQIIAPYFFACGAIYSPISHDGKFTEVISQPNCFKDIADHTISIQGVLNE